MNNSTTKTLATAPAVVISTWLVMMVGPFLPALAAWALIVGGLLTVGLLLLGVGESWPPGSCSEHADPPRPRMRPWARRWRSCASTSSVLRWSS